MKGSLPVDWASKTMADSRPDGYSTKYRSLVHAIAKCCVQASELVPRKAPSPTTCIPPLLSSHSLQRTVLSQKNLLQPHDSVTLSGAVIAESYFLGTSYDP